MDDIEWKHNYFKKIGTHTLRYCKMSHKMFKDIQRDIAKCYFEKKRNIDWQKHLILFKSLIIYFKWNGNI